MTEDQIERAVERQFDSLNAQLMNGSLTQSRYDAASKRISRWAELEYARTEYERRTDGFLFNR
jgi:hypothetical protein